MNCEFNQNNRCTKYNIFIIEKICEQCKDIEKAKLEKLKKNNTFKGTVVTDGSLLPTFENNAIPVNRPVHIKNEIINVANLNICKECENFNGNLCEKEYPTGCCVGCWNDFLNKGSCPLSKWTNK